MAISERENYLRTVKMGRDNAKSPEWIPCRVVISGASYNQLRDDVEEVMAQHPVLFPAFEKGRRDYDNWDFGPAHRAGEDFEDAWGCIWRSDIDGIEGVVINSLLAEWDDLASYEAPDPVQTGDRGPVDWEANRRSIEGKRARGELTSGGVPHGYLFMRMYYLRGFENLMYDFATQEPRLQELIDMLVAHNSRLIGQWLDIGVDKMEFGEDLGTQTASIISPKDFAQWITPAYAKLIKPCRDAGCLIALHSDGYIMELMDEFVKCGIDIINPQDLCNGIDALAREVKGRMCIRLDIDRQTVVPFGTAAEVRELIEEEVRKLGSPRGGLELLCGIYPPTPAENVEALCAAMEEFRRYWW
jgi:uroporphyrinogen decarboxylase